MCYHDSALEPRWFWESAYTSYPVLHAILVAVKYFLTTLPAHEGLIRNVRNTLSATYEQLKIIHAGTAKVQLAAKHPNFSHIQKAGQLLDCKIFFPTM